MRNELIVSHQGDYVHVVSNGEKNPEFVRHEWTETVRVCNEHQCYKVLGVATTTVPISTLGAVNLISLFKELGMTRQYRVAWVELNPGAAAALKFLETVCSNRGYPGRVFDNVEEARVWLTTPAHTTKKSLARVRAGGIHKSMAVPIINNAVAGA